MSVTRPADWKKRRDRWRNSHSFVLGGRSMESDNPLIRML